ncbi:ATP-dependent DNA helicase RuvB [Parcubacteria bacterium DG_72]|nr:MAG: ATP-dependent DNA helicase RuvB [Parcubacteria bacterium DG_72]
MLDSTLRPKTWQGYIGQEKVKKNIKVIIEAAQKRKEPIEHLLFYGGSGLGKTTISYIIAKELNSNIKTIAGPTIEKVGDLAAILTNLNQGDVLFIDECHRINKLIEEFLYPAMEDFKLHLILGKGPMARTMDLDLPRFTLIGATTRLALLSSPLRNRFGATFQLDYYTIEDIKKIIQRSAKILNVTIEEKATSIIAQCSRFTPRVANRLVKRIRDFAQVEGKEIITSDIARKALNFLEIDEKGLELGDRKILRAIIDKFQGGPVGLQALAACTSEEKDAILDVYEPYLMQLGFIERTPRGRTVTKSAYNHLGLKHKTNRKLI